jgi:hypothetical protein
MLSTENVDELVPGVADEPRSNGLEFWSRLAADAAPNHRTGPRGVNRPVTTSLDGGATRDAAGSQ